MEFAQELSRPFVSELGGVREEFGAERARRQMAEEWIAVLEAELEALREPRESPQTAEGEPERAHTAPTDYGRVSGGHTEAVVVEDVQEVTWAPRPWSY
jgi:hypothetical protein